MNASANGNHNPTERHIHKSRTRVSPIAPTLAASTPDAKGGPGHRSPRKNAPCPMPSDTIVYPQKFAPKEAYIDDLLNGHLYMNAAGHYQGLPGEQGDPLEASMAP